MNPLSSVLLISATLSVSPWLCAAEPAAANPAGFEKAMEESARPEPPPLVSRTPEEVWNTPEGKALRVTWEKEGHRFTPAVKVAYLKFAKAETRRVLAASGRNMPADFLEWAEGDPVISATVYGTRRDPAEMLTVLRSLEIDLGPEEVRNLHPQLALAMAMVHSRGDAEADVGGKLKPKQAAAKDAPAERFGVSLASRPRLQLRVPGNPLQPVNTHPTDRALDVNDLIVNFFEGRTVEIVGKPGKKGEPAPTKTVPMAACDVIADPKLQEEFNAYMKKHGQTVEVHCGDHVVSRNSTAAVKGPDAKGVRDAYQLFKAAYEAKGLLPAQRDPAPTLAETFAWLIRNEKATLPEGVKRKWNTWPLFPLNAPWPVLTYLAQNRQPLRECEDIFTKYRDKGEFRGYGEYIGPIAQQFEFQSARRLAPYPFAYGTFQMMVKDGGVCGTMANMQARSELALGVPSCTAGQPGHCALVSMRFSPADNTYTLAGSQFVTGGPDKTTPHLSWIFADDAGRRPMIYPMSTTFAVNYGFNSFLDSNLAGKIYQTLPEADRKAHGLTLLQSGLALNPYNLHLAESAIDAAATPQELLGLGEGIEKLVSSVEKPGCPKDGLYTQTVLGKISKRMSTLPLPSDKAVLARMGDLTEKAEDAIAWQKVQFALRDPVAVQKSLLDQLKAGIAGERTAQGTERLAQRINAVVAASPKSPVKISWVNALLTAIIDHETYTVGKKKKVITDPCAAVILKAAGKTAEAAARDAARAKAQSEAASQDLSKEKK